MGDVVPFIARVKSSADWTAAERARLEELADRLAEGGAHVEVIFGATDAGDPWCVVTDEAGDVLIHVARIGGRFVVHSAVDDLMSEGADLHAALRERLAAHEAAQEPAGVVLPFTRQAQTLLALVVATAFFYETSGVVLDGGGEAQAAPLADAPAEVAPPVISDEPSDAGRQTALPVAAMSQPEPSSAAPQALAAQVATAGSITAPTPEQRAPEPPPETAAAPRAKTELSASAEAASPASNALLGTAGDDLLVGTAADERLVGGAGADTLRGGGGHDTLEGGAGDDRIEVSALSVAFGGAGADVFVILAPGADSGPDTLLGVIADFSVMDGDRLITGDGRVVTLAPQPPPAAENAAPPTFGPATLAPSSDGESQTRVTVDLNGDGRADGYVLLTFAGSSPAAGAPVQPVGHSFGPPDLAA